MKPKTQRLQHFSEIEDRYEGFLFDAYGVLVDEQGPIPGAKRLIHRLHENARPFWILSNGSSRIEEDLLQHYQNLGFTLAIDQIISSGTLLRSYFATHSFQGRSVAVLGPGGSKQYVERAGGKLVDWLAGEPAELVVIANQTGYPLLEGIDRIISYCFSRLDQGLGLKVIITNPDLIYPKSAGEYGMTAGGVGLIVEESLVLRYGESVRQHFVRLGKPFAPIFDEAMRRAGSSSLLMIGDQLMTDIKGAKNYGLDSLLVGTGLTPVSYFASIPDDLQPTYTLDSFLNEEAT
ncbi:MAG: HAD-IIA family hydrolase [Oligoflexus sp.]